MDTPQHRNTGQLQHRDQQHLQYPKDRFACKQASAALQGVKQFGSVALISISHSREASTAIITGIRMASMTGRL